jgi:hypothetical protein
MDLDVSWLHVSMLFLAWIRGALQHCCSVAVEVERKPMAARPRAMGPRSTLDGGHGFCWASRNWGVFSGSCSPLVRGKRPVISNVCDPVLHGGGCDWDD